MDVELEDDVFVIVVGVVAVILLILNLLNYAEELWFLCRINPHSPNRQGVIFILTMFPVTHRYVTCTLKKLYINLTSWWN